MWLCSFVFFLGSGLAIQEAMKRANYVAGESVQRKVLITWSLVCSIHVISEGRDSLILSGYTNQLSMEKRSPISFVREVTQRNFDASSIIK
jgi:hypothetical protein